MQAWFGGRSTGTVLQSTNNSRRNTDPCNCNFCDGGVYQCCTHNPLSAKGFSQGLHPNFDQSWSTPVHCQKGLWTSAGRLSCSTQLRKLSTPHPLVRRTPSLPFSPTSLATTVPAPHSNPKQLCNIPGNVKSILLCQG